MVKKIVLFYCFILKRGFQAWKVWNQAWELCNCLVAQLGLAIPEQPDNWGFLSVLSILDWVEVEVSNTVRSY